MASTWTSNNAIEKIADGEKTNTWGQVTNRNLDIIDQAINGVVTIDLNDAATYDLDTDNGTTSFSGTVGTAISDGVNKVLIFSATTADCTITVQPNNVEKIYVIFNNSGQTLTFAQGDGNTTVTIADGEKNVIYCDGAGASASVVKIVTESTLAAMGVTATAAEINALDGSTADSSDFNKLAAITATASELNRCDITTVGETEALKVVTADSNGKVTFNDSVKHENILMLTDTIDPANGRYQVCFKTSGTTNLTENVGDGEMVIVNIQTSGSAVVNLPTTISWISSSGNTAPTLTGNDTIMFFSIIGYGFGFYMGSST